MPSWLPWLVRNILTGEQLALLCYAFPFAALLRLGVLEDSVTMCPSCISSHAQNSKIGLRLLGVYQVFSVLCGTGKQLWKLCKQPWNLFPVKTILRVWLVPYWQPHSSTLRRPPQPQARSAPPPFCLPSSLHNCLQLCDAMLASACASQSQCTCLTCCFSSAPLPVEYDAQTFGPQTAIWL